MEGIQIDKAVSVKAKVSIKVSVLSTITQLKVKNSKSFVRE